MWPGAYPLTHASQRWRQLIMGALLIYRQMLVRSLMILKIKEIEEETKETGCNSQGNRMGNSQAVICRRDGFVRAMVCVADIGNMSRQEIEALSSSKSCRSATNTKSYTINKKVWSKTVITPY